MNKGKLIFAQVLEHLPLSTFRRCVSRYCCERKVKCFSCLDQFPGMAFAQLTCRESLRDIEVCLRAQSSKLYHVGIRGQEPRLVFPSMRLVAECCDRKNREDAFIPYRAHPSLTRRCQMGDNSESKEPRPSRRGSCKPRGNLPPLRDGLPFLPALPSGASWQIFVMFVPFKEATNCHYSDTDLANGLPLQRQLDR